MDVNSPPLWLLTGERGAGKTTFCRLLAGHARAAGWDVAGLLSPAVIEAGVKTGILVEEARSGERRRLASAAARPPFSLPLGRWFFDPAALAWGNIALQNCLPCDLLLVDELGPLELLRGEGWTAAFPTLQAAAYRLALVVVRPELEEVLRARLPVRETIRVQSPDRLEAQTRRWWNRLQSQS
ncbi:MAG: nucleoside-triphosphatase [Anaerolineales bacterium]